MTYGAPRGPSEVAPYLAAIRGGRTPAEDLVAEMTRRYERIGWSPIIERTRAQADALQRELGEGFAVAAGMRYSRPTIADAVRELANADARRLVGIVMSPQWSPMIMSGYERALHDAASALIEPLPTSVAHEWHREPAFIAAIAERIHEALARLDEPERVPLLLTAHSLPRRVFEAEPGYIAQLRETAELIADHAGLARDRWQWAYQSAGHTAEEWLRPDLKELFPSLAAAGHRHVLVVPVQFLADHLEVLYDLDIAAADEASAAGLRYHRTRMPNTQPTFIRALASVARSAVEDAVPA